MQAKEKRKIHSVKSVAVRVLGFLCVVALLFSVGFQGAAALTEQVVIQAFPDIDGSENAYMELSVPMGTTIDQLHFPKHLSAEIQISGDQSEEILESPMEEAEQLPEQEAEQAPPASTEEQPLPDEAAAQPNEPAAELQENAASNETPPLQDAPEETQPENENASDLEKTNKTFWEPDAGKEKKSDIQTMGTEITSVPVEWAGAEYQPEKPGEYIFTAVLPDGYVYDGNLPYIKVVVAGPQNEMIVKFWGNSEENVLIRLSTKPNMQPPIPLRVNVQLENGGDTMVELAGWQGDDYNPAVAGTYVFQMQLPEGYHYNGELPTAHIVVSDVPYAE